MSAEANIYHGSVVTMQKIGNYKELFLSALFSCSLVDTDGLFLQVFKIQPLNRTETLPILPALLSVTRAVSTLSSAGFNVNKWNNWGFCTTVPPTWRYCVSY